MAFEDLIRKTTATDVPPGKALVTYVKLKHARTLRFRICESIFEKLGVKNDRDVALAIGTGNDLGKVKIMLHKPDFLTPRKRYPLRKYAKGIFGITVPIGDDYLVNLPDASEAHCEAFDPSNGGSPYVVLTLPPKALEVV